MPGELGPAHHWMLTWLDKNCRGLVNAKTRDELLAAMLAAGIKTKAGTPMNDSAMRRLKEEIIEAGYLVCGTKRDGYWRPVNMAEVTLDTREKWMLVADLKFKALKMEEVAARVFGPQQEIPGIPAAGGEAQVAGYGVP